MTSYVDTKGPSKGREVYCQECWMQAESDMINFLFHQRGPGLCANILPWWE